MIDWAPSGTGMLPVGGEVLAGCATVAMAGCTTGVEAAAEAGTSIELRFCALGFVSIGWGSNCWGICSGSGRLLSAWGKTGLVGGALLSVDGCHGFAVVSTLLSSVLPHDLRQSLGGAAVTGATLFAVVPALGAVVAVMGFVVLIGLGKVALPPWMLDG
jgi:hypothetical protein